MSSAPASVTLSTAEVNVRPATWTGLACTLLVAAATAGAGDYDGYTELLARHVDERGMVDYAAWKAGDEAALRACVETFAGLDPDAMGADARKAYWINVYNAVTILAVLEHYPVASIKDIDDVWDDYGFGPEDLSLNHIEHKILRPMGDPRIHAAIVCASKGCPPLRNEAYEPERLDAQLDDNCRVWLTDPGRGLRIADGEARVSSVFHWFDEDFPDGDEGTLRWIARYVPDAQARRLRAGDLDLAELDWDWSLNAQ